MLLDPGAAAHPTILIVEPERLIAYELEYSLAGLGYPVASVVPSGEEALATLPFVRPDVVLLNLELGGEHGGELGGVAAARAIRDQFAVPVVFVLRDSDPRLIAEAMRADPYGFVVEPFTPAALAASLQIAVHRHHTERQLAQKTALLEAVVSSMEDAVLATDEDGRILVFNDAAKEMFERRLGDSEQVTRSFGSFTPERENSCPPEDVPLLRAMQGDTVRGAEMYARGAQQRDGRWYSINATPLRGTDGELAGGVMVSRDVTHMRLMQSELQRLSDTDPLTGTFNRRGFVAKARDELQTATTEGAQAALFFVDLNGMKRINDTLGHGQGDQAIRDATDVLKQCFTSDEVVGRLGGDEFAILSPSGEDPEQVTLRLRSAIDVFNSTQERQYRLSISIGACHYDPANPTSIEGLVERADVEMYRDKQARRGIRS